MGWRVVVAATLVVVFVTGCQTVADQTPPRPRSLFKDGEPGRAEAFLVVMAPFELETVFLKESLHATAVLGRLLHAEARTVLLSSHLEAPPSSLPATRATLHRAITDAGHAMQPEEDILVVYITSHGRRDEGVLVRWRERTPDDTRTRTMKDDLSPASLKRMLDDGAARKHLVIVSACYAGQFVDVVASDDTWVMAAAHRDRPSFGCEPESDLTYFGRAFLDGGLSSTKSLSDAFSLAELQVAVWETERGVARSRPLEAGGARVKGPLQRIINAP